MRSDQLLTLTQWLSPAFPIGAFTYTHGLEAAFDAGWVRDGPSLQAWLTDLLTLGSAKADAHFLSASYLGDAREVDQVARAFAPCAERLLEAEAQGRAFAQTVGRVWGRDLDGLIYPVALGRAARLEGLPVDLTLTLYLQAFVTSLVTNAQRLGPIGQTEAQLILRDLTPALEATALEASESDLSHVASATFLSDIAAMKHETQHSRIFRS
ncbi:MAG: urease accessory protein UreF [Maritimibacter sp.]